MWDGLSPISMAPAQKAPSGWKEVLADGVSQLDAECFVSMTCFRVKAERGSEFEMSYQGSESRASLERANGFKGLLLFHRDGKIDDGINYASWSVWEDEEAYKA